MKTLRNIIALGAMAGAGVLAYAWGGERPRMKLTSYRLPWPASQNLKVLHLSDQHLGADNWVQRARFVRLSTLLPQLKPDIILLTGDFLHDDAGLTAVEKLLQILPPAPLGRYAVLGNHDYALYSYGELFRNMARSISQAASPQGKLATTIAEAGRLTSLAVDIYRNQRLRFAAVPNNVAELMNLLAKYDVQLLRNQAQPLPHHPHIWLAGVDDLVEGQPDLSAALAPIPADAVVILLTHNPDLAYEPEARRAHVIFAGHTHGGQVRLPLLGAIHTQGTRLPRQHPAGVFFDLPGSGAMIVSSGMGESTPLRLGVPPEVVFTELYPYNEASPKPEIS